MAKTSATRQFVASPRRTARHAGALLSVSTLALSLSPLAATAAVARLTVAQGEPLSSVLSRVALPPTSAVDVALIAHDAAGLRQLISAQSTPGNAEFRHFLTTSQFSSRFGPRLATTAKVTNYFRGFGLSVRRQLSSGLLLHVSGSTSSLARAFSATLVAVRRADGIVATQFDGAATLPASIANAVAGVGGQSTWRPRTTALAHSTRLTSHIVTPSSCSTVVNLQHNAGGFWLPGQQAAAYGLDHQWANSINGAGQTIAVFELANYRSLDLSNYFNCFGVHAPMTTVNVDGGPVGANNEEADLDIQEASVLAPGASIIVYQGPNGGTGPLDTYAQIANANVASVVTTSWGGCESNQVSFSDMSTEATVFNQMAAQGQTVFAAAGDAGSSDCEPSSGGLAVDDPASQPSVTAVGGLTLDSIATVSPPSALVESVWNNGSGAGGGGRSVYWPQPSWQQGTALGNTGNRMVPDLSVMADPQTGFLDFFAGGWNSIGGTSIGSPIMAAVVATANQACGSRLGVINPAIYLMAASGTGFNDVTSGSNAILGDGTSGLYSAATGYDLASGLGSPDPSTFINGLCSIRPSAINSSLSVSPSASPIDLVSGAAVSLTVRSEANNALSHVVPTVTATQAGATVSLVARSSSTNSAGTITFDVTTSQPGTVALSFKVGAVVVASTNVIFNSSVALVSSLLSSLGPIDATIQSAQTGSLTSVAVDLNHAGQLVGTSGVAGVVTNYSTKLHLHTATGAPALSCDATSCLAALDVGGHLVVVRNVNSPSTASAVDLATASHAASLVRAGSMAIVDHRDLGYFDVSFLTTTGQVVLAQWNGFTNHFSFVNLSVANALPTAIGATALVVDAFNQCYVAVRIGSSYRLVSSGAVHGAINVAIAAHYDTTIAGALASSPVMVRDLGSHNQLLILGRTALGKLVLFGGSAGSPNTITGALTLAPNGATAAQFLPLATVNGDDVLYVNGGGPQLAVRSPSWHSLSLRTLTGAALTSPVVSSGGTPLLFVDGAIYAISP